MNKIDFCVVIGVKNANPNAEPLPGRRPRITLDGNGFITDVCLKRKIRNRLQDMGYPIYYQAADRCEDGFSNLQERAMTTIPNLIFKNPALFAQQACETWIDVRTFGQVFAISKKGRPSTSSESVEGPGASIGIRGPLTIQPAISINPIDIAEVSITKSAEGSSRAKGAKPGSDRFGYKAFVPLGIYTTFGTINAKLAEKTGFTSEDAEAIHEALKTLFENDASSARPSGSMEVLRVFWWTHSSPYGSQPSGVVHRSVEIHSATDYPTSWSDFEISSKDIPGVELDLFTSM